MTEVIGGPGGAGEEEAGSEERCSGDDAGMGVPVLRFVVAVGAVDGVEDQDASCGGHHAIREHSIAKIIMCPADGLDLLIMKGHAVEINAVVLQLYDGACKPLVVDGLHVEVVAYCIGAYVGASFFQYEDICLRLCNKGDEAKE